MAVERVRLDGTRCLTANLPRLPDQPLWEQEQWRMKTPAGTTSPDRLKLRNAVHSSRRCIKKR
jgi:hypothetical protein